MKVRFRLGLWPDENSKYVTAILSDNGILSEEGALLVKVEKIGRDNRTSFKLTDEGERVFRDECLYKMDSYTPHIHLAAWMRWKDGGDVFGNYAVTSTDFHPVTRVI